MNIEAALLIKQNTVKENKQRLKVLLVSEGFVFCYVMYLFLMVFPLNYELGERKENNLSVKFKLLINKTDMFEAALPCLGKKKELLHNTLENHKSVHIHNPCCHQLEPCPSCGHSPACCTPAITEPGQDQLRGSPNVRLPLLPQLWPLWVRDRTVQT